MTYAKRLAKSFAHECVWAFRCLLATWEQIPLTTSVPWLWFQLTFSLWSEFPSLCNSTHFICLL